MYDLATMKKMNAPQPQPPMGYYWLITEDHISRSTERSAVGVAGPCGGDETLLKYNTNRAKFEMFDDDDELYYVGYLYGDYTCFEPLDDFGMPNAGCTKIKVNGELV